MGKEMRSVSLAGLFLVSVLASSLVWSDELSVSKLYSDDQDITHFGDEALGWNVLGSADDAPEATALLPAKEIGFLHFPASYRSSWHPAPRKQYVMVMEGAMEVEVGDGEKRIFRPGSVLLVTDTEGRGHKTSAVEGADVVLVWVPVP